jgi:hypothetical protein
VSNEVTSQPERRARRTPNDSNAPVEELAERLKLLGDFTRLQLAATLTKIFEDLARRDADEIFKRSRDVLELTQAADIIHGWSREKLDVWY